MKQELLDLMKKHSYSEGSFMLSSKRMSKFYIDCKNTLLLSRGHFLIGNILCDLIEDKLGYLEPSIVAGVELGGCSIASAVSTVSAYPGHKTSYDALFLRKSIKDHGSQKRIEGVPRPNSRVVLVEDVLTTGRNTINALAVLEENDYDIAAVIAIVDRSEGATDRIQDKCLIPVISLFTLADFE
jgi:orotate phosphoribosyltransferase